MTAVEIVDCFRSLGYVLRPNPPAISLRGPGPPPAVLLEELRANKWAAIDLLLAEEAGTWSSASNDYRERFGVEHSRLYPYLGKHVQHRDGWGGRLAAVFADYATVHVAGETRVRLVDPRELLPPDGSP